MSLSAAACAIIADRYGCMGLDKRPPECLNNLQCSHVDAACTGDPCGDTTADKGTTLCLFLQKPGSGLT